MSVSGWRVTDDTTEGTVTSERAAETDVFERAAEITQNLGFIKISCFKSI